MPTLHNLKNGTPDFGLKAVYIGRKSSGMHYGNPYSHLPLHRTKAAVQVKTLQEAINKFRDWLDGKIDQDLEPERRQWILSHLDELRQADVLLCFCSPEPCHGDVYLEKL